MLGSRELRRPGGRHDKWTDGRLLVIPALKRRGSPDLTECPATEVERELDIGTRIPKRMAL